MIGGGNEGDFDISITNGNRYEGNGDGNEVHISSTHNNGSQEEDNDGNGKNVDNDEGNSMDEREEEDDDDEIMEIDKESSVSGPSAKENHTDNHDDDDNNDHALEKKNKQQPRRSTSSQGRVKHREVAELLKDAVSAAASPATIFTCDSCGFEPLLDRWNCQDCENFDLCKECYEKTTHDKSHRIEYIPKASGTPLASRADSSKFSSGKSNDFGDNMNNPHAFSVNANNITYNPRRRSSQTPSRAPHAAMDDMNHILDIADIGKMPPSSLSSSKALAFLQTYDASSEAFKTALLTTQPATGLTSDSKSQRKTVESKADTQLLCLLAMAISEISLPTRGAPSKKYKPAWNLSVSPRNAPSGDKSQPVPGATPAGLTDSPSVVRIKLPSILMAVLAGLEATDQKGWFIEPVPQSVKEYHEVIQRPSDISTTRSRLLAGDFNDPGINWDTQGYDAAMTMIRRFRRSIRRIWHNAMVYYKKDNEIYEKAASLSRIFAFEIDLVCSRFGISYEELAGGDSKGDEGVGNIVSSSQNQKSNGENSGMDNGGNDETKISNSIKKRVRDILVASDTSLTSPTGRNKLQKTSSTDNSNAVSTSTSTSPISSSAAVSSGKDLSLHTKIDKVAIDQVLLAKDIKGLKEEIASITSKIDLIMRALKSISSDI